MSHDIGVLDLDVTRFDGVFVAGFLAISFRTVPLPKQLHVFGPAIHQPQARAHDVRGVVHRDHPLP